MSDAVEGPSWDVTLGAVIAERDRLRARVERLAEALRSIAANTCCDKCQEAALVARAALKEGGMIDFDNLIEWARRNQGEIVRMDAEVLRALRLARAAEQAEKAMKIAVAEYSTSNGHLAHCNFAYATDAEHCNCGAADMRAALTALKEARNG